MIFPGMLIEPCVFDTEPIRISGAISRSWIATTIYPISVVSSGGANALIAVPHH